jgi:uncharacterized protein
MLNQSALTPLRCLADLTWLLQSPPLLSTVCQRFNARVQCFDTAQAAAIMAWLKRVDAEQVYAAVINTQPKKDVPMRLGRYAETLMHYFLAHAGVFELIAANLPLRSSRVDNAHKDHTTVGEIDYLLRDSAYQAIHWELAVKFYICQPQPSHSEIVVPHDFKGPAGVDTLGLKLSKMFDKQLRHQPPAPYDAVDWQPASYTRGYLFYSPHQALPQCDALNPAHGQGWWLTIKAFEIASDKVHPEPVQYVCLPRLYWLAKFDSRDLQGVTEVPVLSHAQMLQWLRSFWCAGDARQGQSGQLIACVAQRSGYWVEVSRGFVMP